MLKYRYNRADHSLYKKLRTKMARCIYKSDILWVFLFITVGGMLLHFMAWQYEPPDLMSRELSPAHQKRLIDEYRREKNIFPKDDTEERGFGAIFGPLGQMLNSDKLINTDNGKLLGSTLAPSPLSELAVIENLLKNESLKLNTSEKMAKYKQIQTLLHKEIDGLIGKRDQKKDETSNSEKVNASEFLKNWNLRKTVKPNDIKSTMKPAHIDLKGHANGDNNAKRIPNILKNLENETEHVREMEQEDKEQWMDEQVNEILQFMFNSKKKKPNVTVSNLNKSKIGKLQGGPAHCTLYDLTQASNHSYECVTMDVVPAVKVCLYPSEKDVHISKHIREEGMWEPHIVKEFQNLLYARPNYGFIDIGANIGVYTLVAASMGHPVVAVEPFVENLHHLHQAVQLGNLSSRVTALRNAVYDERRDYLSLKLSSDNQGGVALDPGRRDPCLAQTCTNTVGAILMDDLLEVINFDRALIKIDIEGFEHRAFRQSQLLFDRVSVSHIFMEWIKLRAYYGSEADSSPDKTLVHELVSTLFARGFRPFSLVTGIELKRAYWYAWPDDIIWKSDLEFTFQ